MHAIAEPIVRPTNGSSALRQAQAQWESTPVRQRLRIIRNLRYALVEHSESLAEELAMLCGVTAAEKLMSEVLPLIDACRWLEKQARTVLRSRRYDRRGRSQWLGNVSFDQQQKAYGVILVVGPGNYPLFLPAVHTLQALVAGNAVLWKPAPASAYVATQFVALLYAAGLDRSLVTVLPEQIQAVQHAINEGVDKVVFTGASANGRDLLAALAPTNTPAIVELSGDDAVIALADANIKLVVRALRFGFRLNQGATCLAPRRVIAEEPLAPLLRRLLTSAERSTITIESARDAAHAVQLANESEFGLGASIFSRDLKKARLIAGQLRTGFVSINDIIAPSADPRVPFGGVKASGFGITRGPEGLLEMTYPHVIATRRDRRWSHLEPVKDSDTRLFKSLIATWHGRARARIAGVRGIIAGILERRRAREEQP